MCRWRSGHILRERVALCPIEGDQSHAANLKALGLRDNALPTEAVPIEIIPTGCLTSVDAADWTVTVDLPASDLPDWARGLGFEALKEDAKCAHLKKWKAHDRTTFGGDLDLSGTGVKSLGKLASVGGELDLSGNQASLVAAGKKIAAAVYVDGVRR